MPVAFFKKVKAVYQLKNDGCNKFIETIIRLYFYQDNCFVFSFVEIMKETKKQIKAQLTNEISLRFKKRIDILETELKCVRSELRECDNQRRKAERTVLELQDKVEKYEDWNRRLQEFMDMTPEEREKIIQDSKLRVSTNERLNKIMDMFQYFW